MTTADVSKGFHLGLERAAAYLETTYGWGNSLSPSSKELAEEIRHLPQEADLFGGEDKEVEAGWLRFQATMPIRCGSNPPKPAKVRYYQIIKRGTAKIPEVQAGAERYAKAMQGKNPEHVKQMITWLNQNCWEDPMWSRPQGMEERASLFNAAR
jgi:hypothetical protein